jgi:aromatic ring-cleaving dioxygenase
MSDTVVELPVQIDGYHAHVYYDSESRPLAAALRERVAATLDVACRDLADAPRGPHPVPQFRFSFTTGQFAEIVPWLMLNRQGLDVLVHPLTRNSHADHSAYAIWLGEPKALKLSGMRGEYRAEQYPTAAG